MDLKLSSPLSSDASTDPLNPVSEENDRLRASLAHAHALLAAKNELLTVREDQVRHLRTHSDDLRRQLGKTQEMLERTQRFLISALRHRGGSATPEPTTSPVPALLEAPAAPPAGERGEPGHLRPYQPALVPAGPAEDRLKRN